MNKLQEGLQTQDTFRSKLKIVIIISLLIDILSTLYQTSFSLITNFFILGLILKFYQTYHKTTIKIIALLKILTSLVELLRCIAIASVYNSKYPSSDYWESMKNLYNFQFYVHISQQLLIILGIIINLYHFKVVYKIFDGLFSNKFFHSFEGKK